MLVSPRRVYDLSDLCLRNFPRVNAGQAPAVEVHVHGDTVCLGRRFLENALEDIDHELHGCVVVVEQHDAVQRRLFGFLALAGCGLLWLGFYTASRPSIYPMSLFWSKDPARSPATLESAR